MATTPEKLRKWAEVREAINERHGDHRLSTQLLRDAAREIEHLEEVVLSYAHR